MNGYFEQKKAAPNGAAPTINLKTYNLFLQINFYLQLVHLLLVDFAWGAEHHIAALVVLGEGNAVAD